MLRTLVTSLIISAVLVSPAAAACSLGNIAGKWAVYGGGVEGWVKCRIAIRSDGTITDQSRCDFQDRSWGLFSNGRVRLADGPTCRYSATFEVLQVRYTLVEMTLSRDDDSAAGVGRYLNRGFAFFMVRQ